MIISSATIDDVTATPTKTIGTGLLRREFMSLASDLLPPCDFVCLLAAGYLSSLLYSLFFPDALFSSAVWNNRGNVALIGAVLAPIILYDQNFAVTAARRQTTKLIRAFAVRFVLIIAITFAIGMTSRVLDNLPHTWVAIWLVTSLALTSLTRFAVATYLQTLKYKGALTESIALVGAGSLAQRLSQHLRRTNADVDILGIFADRADGADAADGIDGGNTSGNDTSIWPVSSVDALIKLSRARRVDWILVALPEADEAQLQSIVQRLKPLSIPIALCPQHLELRMPCKLVDYVANGMPVILLADRPIKRWNAALKAAEDVILGSLIAIALVPVFALIALAIKLESPGPIIFKQRRHTFNNGEFDIYKFRTMRWNPAAVGAALQQTSRNDHRVTRLGRFLRASSLDELPQLFNVLKGEMSLVGPRPHAVNMRTEDRLGCEITDQYPHRHRVEPGMTGWSQVNGARGATRTTAELQRRIDLDLYYIENWSIGLDLKILLMTCREVLKRTNAY